MRNKRTSHRFDEERNMKNAKIALICLLSFSFLVTGGAHGVFAAYPDKKIRVIVNQSPGGSSDLTARLLVQHANPYLGGQMYVENVTGASGAIGTERAATSPPDGYTLMLLVTNTVIGPFTVQGFPPIESFDPVCLIAKDPTLFVVKADSRFKSIQEFVSFAKAHPGELNIGNAGIGSATYLASEAFNFAAGIKVKEIAYKGSGPALVAAMGGHVDGVSAGGSEVLTHVQANQLRPLVTYGEKRSRLYPNFPTAKELGYNMTFEQWRGVGLPKGTPEDVKKILVDAFRKTVESEQFKKNVEQSGLELSFLGPKEFGAWLREQSEATKVVIDKLGLKPE
jgi:tripartite-type tricarboxylate transporter receptor subunit TctC